MPDRLFLDLETRPYDRAEWVPPPEPCECCGRSDRVQIKPARQQPIVMSYAWNAGPVQSIATLNEARWAALVVEMLAEAANAGVDMYGVQWVGHYVAGYDLPIIRRVLLRYGLDEWADKVPHALWDRRAVCTQKLAAGADPRGGGSLDDLARGLGHEVGKGEHAELDFHTLWKLEEEGLDVLVPRCEIDVELTRYVWGRYTGNKWAAIGPSEGE